jgi:hypothetical protein
MKKNLENYFDIVIIGSSPISMLEAVYWASKKKSVAIIEKNKLGGCWWHTSALGFEKLEVGPHVFFGVKAGYKIVKKLGLVCQKKAIWDFDIHNKRLYKRCYNFQMYFGEALSRLKKKIFRQDLGPKKFYLSKIFINFLKNKVAYLEKGCPELLSAIFQLKKWQDVNVVFAECQNIVFDKDKRLNITTSAGSFICDKVIVTSNCDVDFMETYRTYNNYPGEISFERQKFGSAQVSLLLKNNFTRLSFTKFQYESDDTLGTTNIAKKKKFKYIIDLTDCVEKSNDTNLRCDNLSVVSLAVDPEYYDLLSKEPDMYTLVDDLKQLQLISKESELLQSHNEIVQGNSFTHNGVLEINRLFEGKICCLMSESLIDAFSANSKRWLKILDFKIKIV